MGEVRLLVVSSLVTACSFTPGMPLGSGPGPGDGGDPDGTHVDARPAPGPGACGTPGVLADKFSDGVPASFWSVVNSGDVVEAAGTLAITPTVTELSGYHSRVTVDLHEAAAEVEVRTMLVATDARAQYRLVGGGETIGFFVQNGELVANIEATTAMAPYDPLAHRWWRIEHAGTDVTLATSATGTSWTPLLTAAAPAWIRYARVVLGASNPAAVAAPGTVTYAEHSTYVATASWCPAQTLSDSFDGDSTIGPEWDAHGRSNSACAEYETSSAARVDQYGSGACDAFYGSSALYSLRDSEAIARITSIGTYAQGWTTYIGGWDLGGNFVRLAFDQNEMCAEGTGITRTCVSYMGNQDLWRIREASGTLHFEVVASSSSTWRTVHTVATPFDLGALRLRFGTRTDRAINTTINLSVDRFN